MSTDDAIDWQLTTWEGSRREQLRRWAALPLEQIIQAIADMGEFAESFSPTDKMPAAREASAEYAVKPLSDE
jgi:hypothetical protein